MGDARPAEFDLVRIATGIPGLDPILGGGLFKGGIYIVSGEPGVGKTIFANQLCLSWAQEDRRALYVTLLAETHARMLAQVRSLGFYDEAKVGTVVKYVNGFAAIEGEGLAGLLKLLRVAIRDHSADLLVLDGMVTASAMADSTVDYKKFINELQTWVGMLGCTVLFLTSTSTTEPVRPEHTMVDGIFELTRQPAGSSVERHLSVTKLRASGFLEGPHAYTITDRGLSVYPRLEACLEPSPPGRPHAPRVPSGIPGLDPVLDGGVPGLTTTLLFGPSGCGKSLMGLQFLREGLRAGEPVVMLGLFERRSDVLQRLAGMGLEDPQRHVDAGKLTLKWFRPAEQLLDVMGYGLLDAVEATRARRVFIDGLAGIKAAADTRRLSGFFATLSDALAARGATTLVTEETRELFVQHIEIPTEGVSAMFQNIIFLRNEEVRGVLRRVLTVMKSRDVGAARRPFEYEIDAGGVRLRGGRTSTGETLSRGVGKGSRRRLITKRTR